MRKLSLAGLLFLLSSIANGEDTKWTLAFGSCSRPEKVQPLWPVIAAQKPDAWLWLGDIVYGDTGEPEVLKAYYAGQTIRKDFQEFQKAVPIQMGIYDDHDFGINDVGRENPIAKESMQLLLDFLREAPDSPRRSQPGAYASYSFGKPGQEVKLIILDTRYNRDPRGSDGAILGEVQWKWLENELTTSKASIHLIASSIQVVAEEHRFEKWMNFPSETKRLYTLIAKSGAPGVIFLSGDRHIAELSRQSGPPISYSIYDLTSSGLTHSWKEIRTEANRHRVGNLFVGLNFGLVTVNWTSKTVRLDAYGVEGKPVIEKEIPFAELATGHVSM